MSAQPPCPAKCFINLQFIGLFRRYQPDHRGVIPGRGAAATIRTDRQNVAFAANKSASESIFGEDSMPSLHADRTATRLRRPDVAATSPATAWTAPPSVSDDECLALLAKAVNAHDPESLDQVAWLIGRLAVPIE
jgi:hypothetical protein